MEEKSALRKKYKLLRDSLIENAPEYSREICKKCAALPEFQNADTVLLYFAKGSEADLSALFDIAREMEKRVAYPRCLDRGHMEFFEISDFSQLEKGNFGIMEPKVGSAVCSLKNAICFVPALSFDLDGYRLGYGGGYYDRFLESFSGYTVGITYDKCLAERLPREGFDKKTDYIITESRVKKQLKVKGIHAAPALVTVVAAMMCAADYLDISKISGDASPYLTLALLQIICIGLPFVFFCLLRGNEYRASLGIRMMKVKHITLSVYSLIFIVSGTMALSLLMYTLFPEAFAASGMDSKNAVITQYTTGDSIYAAVTFAILPAILEELLFRGAVRAEYSKYGGAAAVILSSVLFAFLHFSPVRFPLYFFTGIVLALTAGAADSIMPTVIIHIMNNVFVLYFEKYIYRIAGKHSGGIILLTFIVVSVMLISAIMFFVKAEKLYFDFSVENKPAPLIRKVKPADPPLLVQAFLSPTLLILCAFWAVASFLL